MLRTLLLTTALVVTSACSGPETLAGRAQGVTLPLRDSVLLLGVNDAEDAVGEPVPGSGNALQLVLRGQLAAREWDVLTLETTSRALAFAKARELRMNYMLEARLTDWHDAGIDFRDEADRCAVELWLWRVADEQAVAFGREAREGGSLADVKGATHRLVAPLMSGLLGAVLEGGELEQLPAAN